TENLAARGGRDCDYLVRMAPQYLENIRTSVARIPGGWSLVGFGITKLIVHRKIECKQTGPGSGQCAFQDNRRPEARLGRLGSGLDIDSSWFWTWTSTRQGIASC